MSPSKLGILVLGSLGPNQDRILALSKRVRRLVYAYTEFHPNLVRLESHIPCIPLARRNLAIQVRYLIALHGINVVYSLLNAADESTEVTLELLDNAIETPIVRHYKEHPCIPTLEERRVLLETAGQIYINQESYEYFRHAYNVPSSSAHILDADMIAARYMGEDFSPKARFEDKEPHLLVAGGMSALNDRLDVRDLCEQMSRRRVHVHLYGYMVTQANGRLVIGDAATRSTYEELEARLPYVHLHPYIRSEQFCSVWSRYDVGFMHSQILGKDEAAQFEEMNYPYRYTAYLAAGLPLAVSSSGQSAMRALIEQEGIGLVYRDYADLAEKLYDDAAISALSATVRLKRKSFSFDSGADELLRILRIYAANT
jgi:glycosyltransferase involved in cell wall biosynthesis